MSISRKVLTLLTLSMLILIGGCWNKPDIVKHPDAPMLIVESRGQVKVAVYDGQYMVDYGWIEVPEGWTLVKRDWKEAKKRIEAKNDHD